MLVFESVSKDLTKLCLSIAQVFSNFASVIQQFTLLNQTNKIVWLVDTIHKAGKISYCELNDKWVRNEKFSGGIDLSKRTLHKWIDVIFDTFGVIVANEGKGEYRYYLENPEEIQNGSMERWLFDINSVSNALIDNKSLHKRIMLEHIPSGLRYMNEVMEAMKQNKRLRIISHDYYENKDSLLIIEPYLLRLRHQRWYVIANVVNTGEVRRFCLDRIVELASIEETFIMPEYFTAEEFFKDCYGVINDPYGPSATQVLLKVKAFQANYMRDLPLHESQHEIERNEEYSIFELFIRPTYDVYQEVLRMGTEVEVLAPLYMRKEIIAMLEDTYKQYCK